jgi:hypothetical protein
MHRRLAAWALAVAMALMLGACSSASVAYRNARLLYDNAPTFMLWSFDDYIELTDAQKDLARERLQKALGWHRRNVLPGYAGFLAALEAQVDAGLTEEALRADNERLRGYYRDLAEHLLPDAADLFATLDGSQVGELEQRLAKADRRMLEEAASSRARAIGRTIGHLEAWTGPLTDTQRELVKARMLALRDLTPQRVAEWRLRQSRLVALLRAQPPRDEMVAQLRALLFDTDAWRDPAYAQAVRERDDALIGMLAELARTLDASQLAHVKERIRGLQSDIARAIRES